MPQCTAIKRDGVRCKVSVEPGVELCWAHSPENAAQRARITSKAGKSKPSRELARLKTRLEDLAEEVLSGKVDRGDAAVVGQLLNTIIRAVSVEAKLREVEELAREVEELSEAVARQQGASNRGA